MYPSCPKCGAAVPVSKPHAEICPGCGLVFWKYEQSRASAARPAAAAVSTPAPAQEPLVEEGVEDEGGWFRRWFLYVAPEVETWRVYAGAALLALSVFMGIRFFLMNVAEAEIGSTFMHTAMVPFHEFGHIAFMPFGEFMHIAGGSLAQWLMPLGFLALFSFKNRDNAAAALMLWWCGTQFIDLAPYAYDAFKPTMVLLTGRTGDEGAHDYVDMLGDLGLLRRAREVAWVMHKFGLAVMIVAWAWGAWILWRQYQNRTDFVRG